MTKPTVDIEGAAIASLGIGKGLDSIFDDNSSNDSSASGRKENNPLSAGKKIVGVSKKETTKKETKTSDKNVDISNKKKNNSIRKENGDLNFYRTIRPGRKRKPYKSPNTEIDVLGGLIEPKDRLEKLVSYVLEPQRIFVAAMALQYGVSESEIVRLVLKVAIEDFAKSSSISTEKLIDNCKSILEEAESV